MADLQYTLGLDPAGFGAGVRGAISSIANIGLAIDGIKKIAAGVSFGVSLAAEFEKTETAINTILKSTSLTKGVMQELADFARSTPFELPGIAEAARALLGAGTSVGDLKGELQILGDIAAGADTDMQGLATILNQVRGKGKLLNEEFLQLTERGVVGLREQLAKVTGIPVSNLSDAMADGKVSADALMRAMQAMTGEGGIFFGAMVNQSKTFSGLMSSLIDDASAFVRTVNQPIMEGLKPVLKEVSDQFQQLTAFAETFVTALQVAASDNRLGEFLGISVQLGLKKAWVAFLETVVSSFQSIQDGLYDAVYSAMAAAWNNTFGEFTGISFDAGSSFAQGFIDGIKKDIPELEKEFADFMDRAQMKTDADKAKARESLEQAGKGPANAMSQAASSAEAESKKKKGGAGGGEDEGRKRIMGFSRKRAGLDKTGGLDEYAALQAGGRGERRFDAFSRGSDRRFQNQEDPYKLSTADAQGVAAKLPGKSFADRIAQVPGQIAGRAREVTPGQAAGGQGKGKDATGEQQVATLEQVLRELQRIRTE